MNRAARSQSGPDRRAWYRCAVCLDEGQTGDTEFHGHWTILEHLRVTHHLPGGKNLSRANYYWRIDD